MSGDVGRQELKKPLKVLRLLGVFESRGSVFGPGGALK